MSRWSHGPAGNPAAVCGPRAGPHPAHPVEQDSPADHQLHLIFHELGHILCSHQPGLQALQAALGLPPAALAVASVNLPCLLRLLFRAAYAFEDEGVGLSCVSYWGSDSLALESCWYMLWYLCQVNAADPVSRHVLHVIQRATRAAFAVAGETASCPGPTAPEADCGQFAPWAPDKLYYATFDPRFLKLGIGLFRLFRQELRKVGENGDSDLVESAIRITPVTTVIPVGDDLAAKGRTWLCYASQQAGASPIQRLVGPLRRLFVGTEYFTRVVPPFAPDERHEHDLFTEPGR